MFVNHWCESWHLHGFCFLLGDGGNDVSMIQEADCGVGVEGKVRLSPSHRPTLTCRSHRFSLCVSCQDLSYVQRRAHTDDSSSWGSIVWVEETKMTGCFFFSFFLIKQKSLISHRSVKSLSRWTVCTDKDLKHVSATILLAESFRLLGKLSFSLSWWKLVERITTTLSLA